MYKFLLTFFLIFCTVGCSSFGVYNAATGRKEFIFISTAEEISLGKNVHKGILEQNKLSENEERVARIERIGQKIALISDRQDYEYKFFVIEKDEMNAFTTPGGNIYFYTGLMDKLETDDRIAAVLAHEIGHCAARHTAKKFQAALGYNLISSILLGQLEDGSARVAAISSNTIMSIVFSAYGRKDEHEADRLGVKYLYLAGYDVQAAVEVFQILQKESGKSKVPLILRTHPHLEDRIEEVQREVDLLKSQFSS